MSGWKEVAHYIYGEFWYADPIAEIEGLTQEQLLWQPQSNVHCILWNLGHIAHREHVHFCGGVSGGTDEVIPPEFEIFNAPHTPDELIRSVGSVEKVVEWVRDVRRGTHAIIEALNEETIHATPPKPFHGLRASHWLMVTAAHTGLHIGRIQLLRRMVEAQVRH